MRKSSPPIIATDASDDPLLSLAEVCRYLDLHRGTIRILRQQGNFPAPIQIGRIVRWRRSWINAWSAAQPRGFGA